MSNRHLIAATDDEIEARFDELGVCLSVSDLVIERGTIDTWRAARAGWARPGEIIDEEPDYMVIDRAQATRGAPRKKVVVVQYPGDVIAAYAA